MADEHVRRRDCGSAKQRVEFVGHAASGAWQRTRVTPAEAGAIVAARAREARDSRLHETPTQRGTAERCIEDHRRTTLAVTPDVEPVMPDAHQPSGRRSPHRWPIRTCISGPAESV